LSEEGPFGFARGETRSYTLKKKRPVLPKKKKGHNKSPRVPIGRRGGFKNSFPWRARCEGNGQNRGENWLFFLGSKKRKRGRPGKVNCARAMPCGRREERSPLSDQKGEEEPLEGRFHRGAGGDRRKKMKRTVNLTAKGEKRNSKRP